MSGRPPSRVASSHDSADEHLLALLSTPLPEPALPAPPSRLGDRIDAALLWGGFGVGLAAVLVLGAWLINGPVYDKLFAPPAPVRTEPRIALSVQPEVAAPLTLATTVEEVAANPPKVTPQSPARSETATASLDRAIALSEIVSHSPRSTFAEVMAPEPTAAPVPAPALPVWIEIPAINVYAPVIESVVFDGTWQSADYAAGYLSGTALPGEEGNVAISGHAGLRGGVFARLGELRPGDDIFVDTVSGRFHYRMRESQVVWPQQVEVLFLGQMPTLSLLTCTNLDMQRLIVTADFVISQAHVLP
ncbi:MAG: sortase [Chloroflexales bacterium]|nr:sortase [Chloroflexales bacterium]